MNKIHYVLIFWVAISWTWFVLDRKRKRLTEELKELEKNRNKDLSAR
jgi:hypothetical protein